MLPSKEEDSPTSAHDKQDPCAQGVVLAVTPVTLVTPVTPVTPVTRVRNVQVRGIGVHWCGLVKSTQHCALCARCAGDPACYQAGQILCVGVQLCAKGFRGECKPMSGKYFVGKPLGGMAL